MVTNNVSMYLLTVAVISFGCGEKIQGKQKKQIHTAMCMAMVIIFLRSFKTNKIKVNKTIKMKTTVALIMGKVK